MEHFLKSESSSAETDGKPIASNAEDSQTVHTSAVANRERLLWMMVVILVVVVGILAIALGTTKMGKQNNVEPNNEAIAEVQDSHETTTTDLTTTAATTTITTTKATTTTTKATVTITKATTATSASATTAANHDSDNRKTACKYRRRQCRRQGKSGRCCAFAKVAAWRSGNKAC